ncbi:MAG: AmmeMemoRadiSam system radical SAM enzyme [Syntrophobacterales bacterium]|nr:MAG: AmmeMemoRadiSam system radical SAM enzyme [Syntrophobacterales bacterium]
MSEPLTNHPSLFDIKIKRKGQGIPDPEMTKREFLRFCGTSFCALALAHLFGFPKPVRAQKPLKGLIKTKLSPYFTSLGGGDIQCELCPKQCRVRRGERGICRVRENRDGKFYSLVYANPCAFHPDPIEKNPLFHVLPGTWSLSLATAGCNFTCKFCQTWEISQASPEDVYSYEIPPEMVVSRAKQMRTRSVSYTYVEPAIFYEYMVEVGSAAKEAGLLSLIHSNGFINLGPLRNLCTVLDAANIDLKGFTETFYRELCGGELNPVLKTLKTLKQENIHVEITNLIIPTKNDDMSLVREMCLWVKGELGSGTPVHFSRFYPLYKLKNLPPTPVSTLEQAREVALSSGLEYVYIGNVPGHVGENTFCPTCNKMLIQRTGYMVGEMHLKEGKCEYCDKPIPGIWT